MSILDRIGRIALAAIVGYTLLMGLYGLHLIVATFPAL